MWLPYRAPGSYRVRKEFPGWFDKDPALLRWSKLADQEYGRNSNPRLNDEADAVLQRYVPISNIDLKFFFFSSYNTKSWANTKKNDLKEF